MPLTLRVAGVAVEKLFLFVWLVGLASARLARLETQKMRFHGDVKVDDGDGVPSSRQARWDAE